MPAGDVVRCLLNKNIPIILHMQRFKNFIQICKFSIENIIDAITETVRLRCCKI